MATLCHGAWVSRRTSDTILRPRGNTHSGVAQSAEHRTVNPQVGSSSLPPGATLKPPLVGGLHRPHIIINRAMNLLLLNTMALIRAVVTADQTATSTFPASLRSVVAWLCEAVVGAKDLPFPVAVDMLA